MTRLASLSLFLLGFALLACGDKDNGTCSAPNDNVQWFWIYENGGPLLGESTKCIYCDNSVSSEDWDAFANENGVISGEFQPGSRTPCLYSGSSVIDSAEACQAAMCGANPPTHDPVGQGHGAWSYIEPLLGGAAGGDEAVDGFLPPTGPDGEEDEENLSCAPVASLSCGQTIAGDTSDSDSGRTQNVDRYEGAVGNYAAPELAFEFVVPADGSYSFSFVDAEPTHLDLDLFLLSGPAGCRGEAAVKRGFNGVEFEAEAGQNLILVVDGFAGAEGAFEASLDCGGVEEEPAPVEPDSGSPDPSIYGSCLFGYQSQHIDSAAHLDTQVSGQYESPSSLPALAAQQAIAGVKTDGWATVNSIEEVYQYVDSDGIYLNDVVHQATGDEYTWLQWYSGDTQVGYIFEAGSLTMVAIVGDGDIYDCTVQL